MTTEREYQKYEFCRAMNCYAIRNHPDCSTRKSMCQYTAKEFHQWLIEHGAKIFIPDGGFKALKDKMCEWAFEGVDTHLGLKRGVWVTGCINYVHTSDHAETLEDDFKFCPYCGLPIKERRS